LNKADILVFLSVFYALTTLFYLVIEEFLNYVIFLLS